MVSRKKRIKASDTRLFRELYSVGTKEKGFITVLGSVIHNRITQQICHTQYGMLTFSKKTDSSQSPKYRLK